MPQQLSPINIETKKAISNARLKPLDIHYNESKPTTIQNTGKLVRINFKGGYISGGFLPNEYVLSSLHIYWGKEDDYGSNHLIDVYKYSGEINLVHWNKKKYSSYEEAKKHDDGLIIISIFLQVSDHKNVYFQKIVNQLDSIRSANTSAPFDSVFYLDNLLPSTLDYFTYLGTTINHSADAVWIIFPTPINIHSDQLSKFRTLLSSSNHDGKPHYITENYRNPYKLNDDTQVYYSGEIIRAATTSPARENYFMRWLSDLRETCFSYYQKYIEGNKTFAIIAIVFVFILTAILFFMSRRYSREKQD
uniref:Cell surface-binding protein OPG105 n=1 Tax=Buffalopox virus TaxID=32605 RepID=E9KIJ4_VACCV|nr:immunogenic envelope protein [Buffalopox virus]